MISYIYVITAILIILIAIILYWYFFKENITTEEAKQIALKYTELAEENVTFSSMKKDSDDREYEIEFFDNNYEYKININYNSKKITKFQKDIKENNNSNISNNIPLTEEEAKQIALSKINKKQDEITFTKVQIDRENGKTVYDIYIQDNMKEYEMSIDVETKEIIAYKENNKNSNPIENKKYIGIEKAKEIVLNHAKLTNNQANFNKIELDVDYNIATYEIEFYYNYYEYDYEINALTGEIIKYEKER